MKLYKYIKHLHWAYVPATDSDVLREAAHIATKSGDPALYLDNLMLADGLEQAKVITDYDPPMERNFVIRSLVEKDDSGDYLYWSNDLGWADIWSATEFTFNEHEQFDRPLDSEWVKL